MVIRNNHISDFEAILYIELKSLLSIPVLSLLHFQEEIKIYRLYSILISFVSMFDPLLEDIQVGSDIIMHLYHSRKYLNRYTNKIRLIN